MAKFTYQVKGMHCKSCELIIEDKISNYSGVKNVKVSLADNNVEIESDQDILSENDLTEMFKEQGYYFSKNIDKEKNGGHGLVPYFLGFILILIFLGINKFGWSDSLNVSTDSPFIIFLFFGLLAGFSTCAALVGGIVLAMSKEWSPISEKIHYYQKLKPHILFNFGRLFSFTIFGAILGFLGVKIQMSPVFTAILVIIISIIMLLLGLQMIGVKFVQNFQIAWPKLWTKKIVGDRGGKLGPLVLGMLTIFLPCGFTLTAEGIAILSGSPVRGALIMFLFALGTLPALLLIGLASVKLFNNSQYARIFTVAAGVLVIFFAFFNFRNQMNVLGFFATSDTKNISTQPSGEVGFPPILNGKQLIKMEASAQGYSPNYFKVRADIPVRWEVTDIGTSGCTNAIISFKLFKEAINLKPGTTSIKEFTPEKPGRYKFSCWMGMVSGIIEVIK